MESNIIIFAIFALASTTVPISIIALLKTLNFKT